MSLPEQMARCLSSAVIVVADNIVQIRTVRLLVNDDEATATTGMNGLVRPALVQISGRIRIEDGSTLIYEFLR